MASDGKEEKEEKETAAALWPLRLRVQSRSLISCVRDCKAHKATLVPR